jgi:DJ-1/PfpI family
MATVAGGSRSAARRGDDWQCGVFPVGPHTKQHSLKIREADAVSAASARVSRVQRPTNASGKTHAIATAGQEGRLSRRTAGVEEIELTEPWRAVEQAGGDPELIAPREGEVQAFEHLDKASRFRVDRPLEQDQPEHYDAVALPGGVANPDKLRLERRATVGSRVCAASAPGRYLKDVPADRLLGSARGGAPEP